MAYFSVTVVVLQMMAGLTLFDSGDLEDKVENKVTIIEPGNVEIVDATDTDTNHGQHIRWNQSVYS